MALLDVNSAAGTFDQMCDACGTERRGLSLDPAAGDLRVEARTLVVRACPVCRARGDHSSEHLFLNWLPHDAGEGPQPGSLVGTVYPEHGSIVIEHTIGGSLSPARQEQARHIRTMQRHPHLAAVAPLHEDWLAAHNTPDALAVREREMDLLDGPRAPAVTPGLKPSA